MFKYLFVFYLFVCLCYTNAAHVFCGIYYIVLLRLSHI
uniref:Uncharacterized protein n=1 Tax=Anguilla anguilla TaxID=7936 RepID=A0A0E9WK60_ANGAN